MDIERYEKRGYTVFKVTKDLGLTSSVKELHRQIQHVLESGQLNIAVWFTEKSFLNTEAVGVCVHCVESVHDHGGSLTIISPNQQILEVLELTTLSVLVKTVDSEDDLLSLA